MKKMQDPYLQNGQEKEVGNTVRKRKEWTNSQHSQMADKRKLNPKCLHAVCFRCGRKLKSEESKILGMGRVCYEKWQQEQNTKPLF